MDVSANGLVQSKSFHSVVIHSHARLTYRVASAMLDGEHFPDEFAHAKSWVMVLGDLFRALLAQRAMRHAIEFDTQETTIHFNSEGTVVDIVPVVRGIAHRVIEECMLAANVSAAEFLTEAKEPILYRVHPAPSGDKLNDLKAFLKDRAISVPAGDVWSSQEYNAVIQSVQGRDDSFVLQMMLLRSMSQAYYSPHNLGHFGLAYDSYGHFTSPIRRYPDLLVHRGIYAVLRGMAPPAKSAWESQYMLLGTACSFAERRADDATRDVNMQLKCQFLADHEGMTLKGVITGVTGFGAFVTLEPYGIEGLLHVSNLPEYFDFIPQKHMLVGEFSRQMLALGEPLSVIVNRVDAVAGKIDLLLDPKFSLPSARTTPKNVKVGDRAAGDRGAPKNSADKKPSPRRRNNNQRKRKSD
ncbi:MAG: RNB domain-containing ribonuclease [Methylocystaceae bacterium]|nr:RNB domain-containing ribonuclease [Methylocystaceae bacterium]